MQTAYAKRIVMARPKKLQAAHDTRRIHPIDVRTGEPKHISTCISDLLQSFYQGNGNKRFLEIRRKCLNAETSDGK